MSALLAEGADPDYARQSGERCLHRAAREGKLLIVQILLDSGATVDATSEEMQGQTALHFACGKARASAQIGSRRAQIPLPPNIMIYQPLKVSSGSAP